MNALDKNTAKLKITIRIIESLRAELDTTLDDITPEGDAKYEYFWGKYMEKVEEAAKVMEHFGIEYDTAKHMVMSPIYNKHLTDLLNCVR